MGLVKHLGNWLTVALLLMQLFACSEQPETRSVLRLNFKQDVPSLDPADVRTEAGIRLTQQIFTGLVALDDSLRIVPALATAWTISDSGRTYHFRLRDDVYFHPHPAFKTPDSTRRITARDVIYSLTRILNSKDASVGAWVYNGRVRGAADHLNAETNAVSGFIYHNDTSLSIHLVKPFKPFLAMLTMPYAYVVPHEVIESGYDFKRLPVGSGLFKVFKRENGQYTILHANERHYAGAPKVNAVQVSFIGEPTTEYTRLKQGQLHLMENPPPAIFRELINTNGQLHTKFADEYRYLKNTQLSTAFLGINLEKAKQEGHPLAKPAARAHLSGAIPREQLPQVVLGCTPSWSLVPPALLHTNENGGYRTGCEYYKFQQPLTLHIANTERRVASFLQASWARAGITVSIQEHQGSALRNLVVNGEVTLWLASWVADYPDAESFYALAYGPLAAPDGPNRSRYRSKSFDLLYERLISTGDSTKVLHAKMQRMLAHDLPVIPLYHYSTHWVLSKDVQALHPAPSSLSLDLQHVTLE